MATHYQVVTQSAAETKKLGQDLGAELRVSVRGATVICLYGELGSGKTTFIQGLAKGLGITARLLSPTFIIVRRYQIPGKGNFFYHVDLYRVKNEADLDSLGLAEILADNSAIVACEWTEKLGSLLPQQRTDIHFATLEDNAHQVTLIWTIRT